MDELEYSKYTIKEVVQFLNYWKKSILIFFLIFTIGGLIIAFIINRQYKSVARVIPPKEGNSLSALSGVSSIMKSLPSGLGALGKKSADELDYFAILKSRTVIEEIINEFDLKRVYEISDSSMEKTIRAFQGNCEIDWTEENLLEIRIWDKDANRAAQIANAYIDLLNKRSYELFTTEARYNRIFIEQRVETNKNDLKNAEDALKKYMKKNKTFIPIEMDASSMSGFGELVTMKIQKEIEVSVLKKTLGEQHPQYIQAKTELDILNKKMSELPNIGIESLRLMREVIIQQKIMEILIPLYEQAKVNEHKDVPAAYVLDNAVPGERPDRPKRSFVVAISSFIGLLFASGFIFYKTHFSA